MQAPTGSSRIKIIVVWHTLSGARERVLLDLVDRWNKVNVDNVTIIPERHEPLAIQLAMNSANIGARPALILGAPVQAATYHQQNALKALNSYMFDPNDDIGWSSQERTDLFPFVFTAGQTNDGAIVGVPFASSARVVLYNKDWLRSINSTNDTIPNDWAQFSAFCSKVASTTRGSACFGLEGAAITMDEWVNAQGGYVVNTKGQVAFPANAMTIGLERMMGFLQTGQAYRVSDLQQSREDFVAARVPFIFDWSNRVEDYRLAVKQKANFALGVGLLPNTTANTILPLQASLWMIIKSANPDRDKYAWKFIKWLSSPEPTLRWAIATGDLPVRSSAVSHFAALQEAAELAHQNDLSVPLWPRIGQAAYSAPVFTYSGCFQSAQSDSMRQILDGYPITSTLFNFQTIISSVVSSECNLKIN